MRQECETFKRDTLHIRNYEAHDSQTILICSHLLRSCNYSLAQHYHISASGTLPNAQRYEKAYGFLSLWERWDSPTTPQREVYAHRDQTLHPQWLRCTLTRRHILCIISP